MLTEVSEKVNNICELHEVMSMDPHPILTAGPRQFSQARARQSYEALVSAARQIFSERGYDGAQTPDIAAIAGVSVGTFYRYFADKREVLLEVFRRDMAHAYQEVMGHLVAHHFERTERRETIEAIVDTVVTHLSVAPRMQQLYLEMSLRDPEFLRMRKAFDQDVIERIAKLLPIVCPPETIPDAPATAAILYTIVRDCGLAIAGAHGGLSVEAPRSQAALVEVLYNALDRG